MIDYHLKLFGIIKKIWKDYFLLFIYIYNIFEQCLLSNNNTKNLSLIIRKIIGKKKKKKKKLKKQGIEATDRLKQWDFKTISFLIVKRKVKFFFE